MASLQSQLAAAQATLDSRPWDTVPDRITVLVMTAEPDGEQRLRIDREMREIQDQVRSSKLREAIRFEFRPAVRVQDLIQHLNEVEPDVVHFSGHGADAGLALHDADDQVRLLSNEDLGRVLAVAARPLKLVVLNSCNSAAQARIAVEHAAAAVGMEQSVADASALVFAGQLYNSLGFGRSLALAFEQAKLAVQLAFDEVSGDPTLVTADGVSAEALIVVAPPTDRAAESAPRS